MRLSRFRNPIRRECSSWINQQSLNLIVYPNPKLNENSLPLNEQEIESFFGSPLVGKLFALMYESDGVGLAAIQVGIPRRFLMINEFGKSRPLQGKLFVNPKITDASEATGRKLEACLSFPDIQGRVERNVWVNIFADALFFFAADGSLSSVRNFESKLLGKTAHIFQHEYDHLNGNNFVDKLYQITDKKKAILQLEKLKSEISKG